MFLPIDDKQRAVPLVPNSVPLAVTYDTTISAATSITLNAKTTFLEVTAIAYGVFMRYQAGVSSSSFDEFIGAGMTRHYIVPSGVTVVSFIEETAGAAIVVIEK